MLNGVGFTVRPGEIVGLGGPSGAGKSVLLKLLGSVMEPDHGSISLDGGGASVGFLFQEGALFDSLSVLENVAFPLISGGKSRREKKEKKTKELCRNDALETAYAILREVGLSAAYQKMPGQLSGGMRRRVALARALVEQPELVLLDDPTGGLDPVAASVIMNLITSLHDKYGPTVVMVSHDLRRLIPRVQRMMVLMDGRIVCDLPADELAEKASSKVLKFLSTRYDFDTNGA